MSRTDLQTLPERAEELDAIGLGGDGSRSSIIVEIEGHPAGRLWEALPDVRAFVDDDASLRLDGTAATVRSRLDGVMHEFETSRLDADTPQYTLLARTIGALQLISNRALAEAQAILAAAT